jgi:hypothetical protein
LTHLLGFNLLHEYDPAEAGIAVPVFLSSGLRKPKRKQNSTPARLVAFSSVTLVKIWVWTLKIDRESDTFNV